MQRDQESVLRFTLGSMLLVEGTVIGAVTIGPFWTLAAGLALVPATGAVLGLRRAIVRRGVRRLLREVSDSARSWDARRSR